MSKSYSDLVTRAVTDAAFRTRLISDPEATIAAEDYEIPPEALAQLKALDAAAVEAAVKDIENSVGNRMAAS